MRYADLSPSTQLLLVSLVAVASTALFTRAIVFFHREKAGIRPVYPNTWSARQCRMLESFRLLVGFALILLWTAFSFIAPSLPTNWPFGYFNTIFIIVLLLISYAWALLLIPKKLVKVRRDFAVVLDHIYFPCGLVGSNLHGHRLDACKSFGITNCARNFWRVRVTRLTDFGHNGELILYPEQPKPTETDQRHVDRV